MSSVEIFLDEPVILDLNGTGIILNYEDEVFVQLPKPEHAGYYISNYARLWSNKSRKILKPVIDGSKTKNQLLRQVYWLPDNDGVYHAFLASKLVASVFVRNEFPDKKTVVHHKDENTLNDNATNLAIITYGMHSAIHYGTRVYLYDNRSGELKMFVSTVRLSDYLGINNNRIFKAIRKIRSGKMVAVSDGIGIIQLIDLFDENGLPVYIGYRVDADGKDKPDDSITVIGLLPSLMQTQNTKT